MFPVGKGGARFSGRGTRTETSTPLPSAEITLLTSAEVTLLPSAEITPLTSADVTLLPSAEVSLLTSAEVTLPPNSPRKKIWAFKHMRTPQHHG